MGVFYGGMNMKKLDVHVKLYRNGELVGNGEIEIPDLPDDDTAVAFVVQPDGTVLVQGVTFVQQADGSILWDGAGFAEKNDGSIMVS